MKTFKQFQASKVAVPDLSKALPSMCYQRGMPGLVYSGDDSSKAYIEGDPGDYLLCLGNMEYTTAEGYSLEALERILYDWCVSERLIGGAERDKRLGRV